MYAASEDELETDDWDGGDIAEYAPKAADDAFVGELIGQMFSRLSEAFPGRVQVADVMFEPGNYTIREMLADEVAEREFAATALPTLKQEIVRQVNSLQAETGDWSVRFDVDGSTSRQRGATTDPFAAVSVLVVEGPLDTERY